MANKIPFRLGENKPDFSTLLTLNRFWKKQYEHGRYYFEDRHGRIPAMEFTIQREAIFDLLLLHGGVQYIKTQMSLQYYAKEDIAVAVVRIHPDTYNQFKAHLNNLRQVFYKDDSGKWIQKPKELAPATENIDPALEKESNSNDQSES